jgi:peroxiredoxin
MHRLIPILSLALCIAAPGAHAAAKVGEPAPAFSAVDSHGKNVSLGDFKGKYVVLEWTNDGCPFVKKHYGAGNMQATQKDAAAQGAVWLSVISSKPGAQGHVDGKGANKLSKDRGATPTHVLLDEKGDVGRLYDAKTTPHMFIVDPDGTLSMAPL